MADAPRLTPVVPATPASFPDLRPGQLILGRYELVRIAGRGGAGTVWQAEDRNLGRPVAIKCLPNAGGDRALGEARAAARLSHPAVVSTYALGNADGCAWLVTEFVAGLTLRQTIVEDTHDDDELLQIGVALCAALRHAHSRGIVHRDVTPRNVLVPTGAFRGTNRADPCHPGVAPAKLADFGIALLRENQPPEPASGRIVGTLSYMAPERLQGAVGDEAGDLWALGVVLHEALVGAHPAGRPEQASALVRAHTDLPSLAPRRPDLPAAVVDAIDRASATDPAARGAITDLELALRQGLRERSVAVAPVLRDPLPGRARTSSPAPEIRASRTAPRPRAAPQRPRRAVPRSGLLNGRGAAPGAGATHGRAAAPRRPRAPRPALLPLAPFAAGIGAAAGSAALLALSLAAIAVLLVALAGRTSRDATLPRVAAGVVVLSLVAAAAGLVVPGAVTAVGLPASGPAAPVVACLVAIAVGACAGRARAPRSIR